MTSTDIELAGNSPIIGLEDYDPTTDSKVPRISIKGADGVFEDNLSNEQWTELDVIVLGVVKQRILWPPTMGDDKVAPLCRSYDFRTGQINPESFPFGATPFEVGTDTVECAACPLKEWGSHPSPDRDTPWCGEQHVYVVLVNAGEGNYYPALLTLQRSSLTNSKAYIGAFARAKRPMFTVHTKISLDRKARGATKYAVPVFTKGADTDVADHDEYAKTYLGIRSFVTTPRSAEDAPAVQAAPAPTPQVESQVIDTVAVSDDDELPW